MIGKYRVILSLCLSQTHYFFLCECECECLSCRLICAVHIKSCRTNQLSLYYLCRRSFADGLVFCALLHLADPKILDYHSMDKVWTRLQLDVLHRSTVV
jgi:hypothetical protein